MTDAPDCKFICFNEVEITSKMLEMVSNPILIWKHTSWPTIQCRKIPFEQHASFQMRIIELLSSENFGTTGRDTVALEPVATIWMLSFQQI